MKQFTTLGASTSFTMKASPESEKDEFASPQLLQFDNELYEETEEDSFGIGAAMPQDVTGLNFLNELRLRIHETHEESPPPGLFCSEFI